MTEKSDYQISEIDVVMVLVIEMLKVQTGGAGGDREA